MSTNPALSTQICRLARVILCGLAGLLISTAADAEDGYDLWLRYRPLPAALRETYARHSTAIFVEGRSPTLAAAAAELQRGLGGLLDRPPSSGLSDGAIVLTSARCAPVGAYSLQSAMRSGHPVTVISGCGDVGALYGAFALLRLIQTRRPIGHLDLHDAPKLRLRMLDHWENLDGTVERGYSGPSLWNWQALPRVDQRMIDYARADASVGINGVVLNNVNADARILAPGYLRKVAALADAWRPYGIRLFVSARFSAPMDLGHLKTADPLDPAVRAWWRAKTDEIYSLIPDFGGFLVKASSEGQPGPQTYGRSHSDGANMIASALALHGGTVLWRAFVYSGSKADDRAKRAYDEFVPLDGKFAANVIVQVKNGPVDFQPREPFHPLFGAMPKTHLAMEVQVTREYLGENAGIAWLGTMWSEALRSRTSRPNPTSRVEDTVTALAGVANAGSDRTWSGSDFD